MKFLFHSVVVCFLFTSCAAQSDSLELGGVTGLLSGAASLAASQAAIGNMSISRIATGAEVGALLGTVVSYFVHRAVQNSRKTDQEDVPQMYFGDLPPNPFVFSKQKAGGK